MFDRPGGVWNAVIVLCCWVAGPFMSRRTFQAICGVVVFVAVLMGIWARYARPAALHDTPNHSVMTP
jgi:hypothetical protein